MAERLTVDAGYTVTVMNDGHRQAWFTRREGRIRGPYSTDHVTQYILLGRIRQDDELSSDRFNWRPVMECPEFHPWISGGDDDPADYLRLTMARIRLDERRLQRRRHAGELALPPGMRERRQGIGRRQVDRNPDSRVHHLAGNDSAAGKRAPTQALRPYLLLTLLLTLVAAWFSIAFR